MAQRLTISIGAASARVKHAPTIFEVELVPAAICAEQLDSCASLVDLAKRPELIDRLRSVLRV